MRYFGSYKNLKEALSYITIILLLASCKSDKQSASDEMAPLHPAPLTVALNTDEGYIINPVTGDSIQPIVNSLGDTVKTGVPFPAKGKVIHPDSVAQPIRIPAGKPEVVPTHLNVHKIPEALTVIAVNKDFLTAFTPGVDSSSFVLVDSTGDTVPTGVPIPAKGKTMPFIQPQPVKALLPRMKENASINMKYLDVEQGMNSSYVRSILEDSHGNLWFGTQGEGLSIYNGETFTHFTEKEGLSYNYVYSLLEDRHGNLWFGTGGRGVIKYNGETFTHFTTEEGLSHNQVHSILEDSRGNLWFGTGRGVSMYDRETFTHYTEKEGLSNNNVLSILEDSHGNLWFGTDGGGVSMYNGETFTYFTQKDGLSSNYVYSILEDSQSNLWFGTGGGVSMYNGESFTHFTQNEGLSANVVRSILKDSHGNLWFGTWGGGVSMYNGETITHFTEKEGLSNNFVWSIMEDSRGNLWFGTRGGGVNIYYGESFTNFTQKEGLSNNDVYIILEDSNGNLWISTFAGGVSMYNGETFTHFTQKEGLSDNRVYSIMEDSHGNLWFGTTEGVSMYNGETFTHFTEKEGLSNNTVRSILEDNQGNLWFGTQGGGVSMYNGETFTHFTTKEGLSDNSVWSILEDSHGNLWFGTSGGGVSMYNGETFTHFTEKEGLSNNQVWSILEDSHGNLWFGSRYGGVSKYNGETFIHFTQKEGLINNSVWSILEDSDSNIWLGTEKGLNRLVFGPESVSDTKNSLSVSGVKEDGVEVTFYNPVIHTYGLQDGLKGIDFYPNSVLLDSKNRIWWGNGKSLTMLDMNNFKIPDEPPAMQLNRIEINGQFADFRQLHESAEMKMKFDSVARFYNYPLNLELPYNRNHLTFHFSAIDWSAPHKIMYSYKMEGLDENWSILTSEAKADYRNLPYGTHTFKVRAIGAAQKWSEPFEYTFTINPPWWHTWLARTGYGIIALLLIFGFVRWRTAALKQRQKELEQTVKERTTEIRDTNEELKQQKEELESTNELLEKQKEELETINEILENQKEELQQQKERMQTMNDILDDQKEELQKSLESLKLTQSQLVHSEKMASIGQLVGGIAHEVNNPVTFISAGVDSLNTNIEEVKQVLDIYHRITPNNAKEKLIEIEKLKEKIEYKETIHEINKLIDSVKTGTVRITEIVTGLRTFSRLDEDVLKVADIHAGLDSTLILLRNKYKKRIEIEKQYGEVSDIECYPGQLNQVFMNILSNAIDAIADKGTITISTSKSNGSIRISIKDSGRGIPEDIQPKIFEPFFTAKEVGHRAGLGLSISHSIIETHNGSIEVNSEVGKGSEFVIVLPVKQSKR